MKKFVAYLSLATAIAFGTTSCQEDKVQELAPTANATTADATTTDVIPSIAAMNQAFNDIANNSCSANGGRDGCIPFQYATDGCYARAHAMRRILVSKGYTCRKVWSEGFVHTDPNTLRSSLACKKNNGREVCVKWWYHVAPLVKVKNGSKIEEYVFDPSMFTKPVTIFTWLKGQRSNCNLGSAVTYHTITPSDRYIPSPGEDQLGKYDNDDSYRSTNATLALYRSKVD